MSRRSCLASGFTILRFHAPYASASRLNIENASHTNAHVMHTHPRVPISVEAIQGRLVNYQLLIVHATMQLHATGQRVQTQPHLTGEGNEAPPPSGRLTNLTVSFGTLGSTTSG